MQSRILPLLALLAACNSKPDQPEKIATARPPVVPSASKLVSVATSDTIWNGVTVADDGRVFVLFPHNEGNAGTRIGELKDGKVRPWPTRAWNAWRKEGDPAKTAFVRANSLRIGPDGLLWVVDTGTPKSDAPPIADGPKLLAFNIGSGQLVKSIPFDKVVTRKSFIDDLRFHGDWIYVTDAGDPAIYLYNQKTREYKTRLRGDSTTTQRRPLVGEGKKLLKPDGSEAQLHADQMEVSPDGLNYYYQTAAGPMYRTSTAFMEHPENTDVAPGQAVQYFFNSPTCGGTTIDAAGNLYVCDAEQKRILKVTPAGQSAVLVQDPRLVWADALWIDNQGNLWIPVPQMNRTAGFQKGVETVAYPVHLYKMSIGAKPFRN